MKDRRKDEQHFLQVAQRDIDGPVAGLAIGKPQGQGRSRRKKQKR